MYGSGWARADAQVLSSSLCRYGGYAAREVGRSSRTRWRICRSVASATICEFINEHRARRSRYHGHCKTHVQHVLTGIAIDIERLASRTTRHPHRPRRPTTFQQYLDARGLTWEC